MSITLLLGITANILLGACGVPQAWKAYQTKSAGDISLGFLLMWGMGDVLGLIYNYLALGNNLILLTNYLVNLLIVLIILRYKIKTKEKYYYYPLTTGK